MNKESLSKFILCILCVLFLGRIISLSGSGTNLEYSQFVAEVQQGKIKEVKLGANPQLAPASWIGTKAFIKDTNYTNKTVNILPNDERIIKLILNNVKGNISIPTQNDWHVWYEELSGICLPLLLSLFGVSELFYIITSRKLLLQVRSFAGIGMVIVVIIMLAHQYWDRAKVHNPLPYVLFIQEVQNGKVANVGLSPDRSRAVVDDKDGYRAIVNLPPDDRLDNILNQNVKGKIYTIPDDRFNAIVIKNNAKVKGIRNYST
jgi:ATP-dependent Zn protease